MTTEKERARLRAISNAIEDFIDDAAKARRPAESVDEVKAAVLKAIPDAKESEFQTALRRLHIASFDETK